MDDAHALKDHEVVLEEDVVHVHNAANGELEVSHKAQYAWEHRELNALVCMGHGVAWDEAHDAHDVVCEVHDEECEVHGGVHEWYDVVHDAHDAVHVVHDEACDVEHGL